MYKNLYKRLYRNYTRLSKMWRPYILFIYLAIPIKAFDYNGYALFQMNPETSQQIDAIGKFEKENDEVDFWSKPKGFNTPVVVLVPPSEINDFINFVNKNTIKTHVSMQDVGNVIKLQQTTSTRERGMSWIRYHTLNEINDWLYSLGKKYPGTVKTISMGHTFEARNLTGVKISFGEGRRSVFIEGGIHAREWISPATVTYIINELLTSKDPEVRKIATSFDWYILPVTNPDGYEYTFTSNRLWRKTRKNYDNCYGADPNRNWDYKWGQIGTSTKPCDQTYGGPEEFSELETSTLSTFLKSIGSNLDVYLSFHSFSRLLLIPYGDSSAHCENYNDLKQIADVMVEALAKRYGTTYEAGTPSEIIYSVSGSSMDWVKSNFKVPIVYTYELRDKGTFGFLLPPDQIIPNSQEVMDSIIAMFKEAEKLQYFKLQN